MYPLEEEKSMFIKMFLSKAIESIVKMVTHSVGEQLRQYSEKQDIKMDRILHSIDKLSIEIKTLESRLSNKEMKDKIDYGQLHYKVNALQSRLNDKKPRNENIPSSH